MGIFDIFSSVNAEGQNEVHWGNILLVGILGFLSFPLWGGLLAKGAAALHLNSVASGISSGQSTVQGWMKTGVEKIGELAPKVTPALPPAPVPSIKH